MRPSGGPWIGPGHRVHFRPFFQQEHENISAALICGQKQRRAARVIGQLEVARAACQVGGDALGVVVDGQFMNGSVLGVMVEKAAPRRKKGATRSEQQDVCRTFGGSFRWPGIGLGLRLDGRHVSQQWAEFWMRGVGSLLFHGGNGVTKSLLQDGVARGSGHAHGCRGPPREISIQRRRRRGAEQRGGPRHPWA